MRFIDKKPVQIIIIVFTSLLTFAYAISIMEKEPNNAYFFTGQIAHQLGEKYHLWPAGLGGGMGKEGKTRQFSISFQYFTPILKDEARNLIIDVTNDFVNAVNGNKELMARLQDDPATFKNVEVIVFCYKKDGYDTYDPYLVSFSCKEGEITYATTDPDHKLSYKTRETETYEEAVAILNQEKSK